MIEAWDALYRLSEKLSARVRTPDEGVSPMYSEVSVRAFATGALRRYPPSVYGTRVTARKSANHWDVYYHVGTVDSPEFSFGGEPFDEAENPDFVDVDTFKFGSPEIESLVIPRYLDDRLNLDPLEQLYELKQVGAVTDEFYNSVQALLARR